MIDEAKIRRVQIILNEGDYANHIIYEGDLAGTEVLDLLDRLRNIFKELEEPKK